MREAKSMTYITIEKEKVMLALEALERVNNFDDFFDLLSPELSDFIVDTVDVVKEALAKQSDSVEQRSVSEQLGEPVEWGVDWGKDGNSVSIIKRLADGSIEVLALEYSPHTQQRTAAVGEDTRRAWVGLSDEDYQVLRDGVVKQGKPLHWMIKHIDAKLKEKNT